MARISKITFLISLKGGFLPICRFKARNLSFENGMRSGDEIYVKSRSWFLTKKSTCYFVHFLYAKDFRTEMWFLILIFCRKKLWRKTIDDSAKKQYYSVLDACLQKRVSAEQDSLVSTLTRGGLVEINGTLSRLFEIVEAYFGTTVSKGLEKNKTTNCLGMCCIRGIEWT